MDAEITQIEPSYDDLAFPPSMPRCDIEYLQNNLNQLKRAYDGLLDHHSKTVGKLSVAKVALKLLADDNAVARDALEEMEKIDAM